jgi:large-conductance mechanosensitive channel
MSKIESPKNLKEFPLALVKNMTALATSGFGVVVALAWNEAIKSTVTQFIDPYLGKNSGVASLFIYASIMTILAVLITMQLSNIQRRLEELNERFNPSESADSDDTKH